MKKAFFLLVLSWFARPLVSAQQTIFMKDPYNPGRRLEVIAPTKNNPPPQPAQKDNSTPTIGVTSQPAAPGNSDPAWLRRSKNKEWKANERAKEEQREAIQTIKTDEGVYVGQAHGTTPWGQGTMTYKNGTKYEGGWEWGHKQGTGIFTFKDGVRLETDFDHNNAGNRGTWYYPNGNKLKGSREYRNAKWMRSGKLYDKDEKCIDKHFEEEDGWIM